MAKTDIYPPVQNPLKKSGRPLHYTPDQLAEKFAEFVEWCKEHPIETGRTENTTTPEGKQYGKNVQAATPRLVSVGGFLVFICETDAWWSQLDKRKDGEGFVRVKAYIREYCENYQKEMASANIFNANIISRLLGLADKKEVAVDSPTIVVKSEEEKGKIENIGGLGV